MAYIGGDQVLLFGGYDGSNDDETWVYDLSDNTWTKQSPTAKPSARYLHALANIGGDQVLLFSGWDGSYDDETWVYDLSEDDWTQQSPTTNPSARYAHAMAYIGGHGPAEWQGYSPAEWQGDQVLLFGGDDGSNDDETWVYTPPEPLITVGGVAVPIGEQRLLWLPAATLLAAAVVLGAVALRVRRRS